VTIEVIQRSLAVSVYNFGVEPVASHPGTAHPIWKSKWRPHFRYSLTKIIPNTLRRDLRWLSAVIRLMSTKINERTQDPLAAPNLSQKRKVFKVLGVRVNAVQIPEVVEQIDRWIAEATTCHFIAVTGMHGVTEAQHDDCFKRILNSADLVVPDGMPLVWLARRHGYSLRRRVYGPELMQTFCRASGSKYRHFFYGGVQGVSTRLANILQGECGINVAGDYSPPFRSLSATEDEEIVALINNAKPDVLWIGLSTPKQERWMYDHRPKLRVPVVIGVGAAFDLKTGRTRQAPHWMREHGLECLFRLLTEPRRLWRRYLVYGSEFVWRISSELMLRRWSHARPQTDTEM
jgi:N-acetylglucosaminyldiphosphoundecaprenol N-acetyl-beta-D-mannosaminyltransferase